MPSSTMHSQYDFAFNADWESCDIKVTYRPRWKFHGTTPKKLKLSPGRAYRVSVRAETTPTDFAEIMRAVPWSNIRIVRIMHGGPIAAADLGKALAKLKGVDLVAMTWPYGATGWLVDIHQTDGTEVQFDLDHWPVDEVTAALGQIRRAKVLTIRMDEFKDNFSLTPLFKIGGLQGVHVNHSAHCEQELDWTGLSAHAGLRTLKAREGFLSESFWAELGTLKHLQDFELWNTMKAKAKPGSLARLKSLRKLNAICMFKYVPEAYQALAECPALENVHIEQVRLDDASAAAIGAMPHVKDCHIWNAELTDAGMQAICRWPKVKSLVLCENSSNSPPISAAGFQALANLSTLDALQLQGFAAVDPTGWAKLRQLSNLKEFNLMCWAPFDVLEAIGPLPSVERLTLSHCKNVGAAGLQQLQAMPRLRSLAMTVHHYSPYHVPLVEISALRQLTSVALTSVHKMSDDDLGRLTQLTKLQDLRIHESPRISDRGVAALASLRNLRVVTLHKLPKLTDQVIDTLIALPRLETLFLRCTTKITDKGLARLAQARDLKTLHLDFARNLTGDRLLQLVRQLPLVELNVDSSPNLTDENILKLAEHATLKRVGFGLCKNITDDGKRSLADARPDWKRPSFRYWQPF